jgi:hypothetical protein
MGEPDVIKYCGPIEKFVSWAAQLPATKTNKTTQAQIRIGPPAAE